jgi:type 1 fimbriae regulatory protein FimE
MLSAANSAALPVAPATYTSRRGRAYLTPEELLSVLQTARDGRTRDWCMILMAYRHGLRSAEVCGLKLDDVRYGSISLQRLQGSLKTTQKLQRHPGVPLLDEVLALREWLRERPLDPSDALFTSQKGGTLHRTHFFRIFQAITKAAGFAPDKRHPRVLRHSLAAHLLANDVDVVLVSKVLGHRSINSTLQYVRSSRRGDSSRDVVYGTLLRIF